MERGWRAQRAGRRRGNGGQQATALTVCRGSAEQLWMPTTVSIAAGELSRAARHSR